RAESEPAFPPAGALPPAWRAGGTPARPPRAAAAMPESSAMLGLLVTWAAVRALASALSANVAPSSGGSSTSAGSASIRHPGSRRANSRRLCSLRVASSRTFTVRRRRTRAWARARATAATWPSRTVRLWGPARSRRRSRADRRLGDGHRLNPPQRLYPACREREQLVQMRTRERRALGRGLYLDQAALTCHHDVRVDVG